MLTETQLTHRQEQLAALKALVHKLEDHDELEIPIFLRGKHTIRCNSTEDLLRKRKLLGSCEKLFQDGEVGFQKLFGAGVTLKLLLPRAEVCERVQVGTERIEGYTVQAYDIPKYEYKCPESLIAKLASEGN